MSAGQKAPALPMMHDVRSSSISHIGYLDGTLFVRFLRGSTYRYRNVTQEEFQALHSAESVGKHLQVHILRKHEGTLVPESE